MKVWILSILRISNAKLAKNDVKQWIFSTEKYNEKANKARVVNVAKILHEYIYV